MAVEQAGKGLSVSICCRLGQVFVAGRHTHHGDETDANGQSLVGFGIYLAVGFNMREKRSAKGVAIGSLMDVLGCDVGYTEKQERCVGRIMLC